MASSLSAAYQNPAGCRVYSRAAPGFFSLPFGPRAVQSGCGCQPAKSVWLPTASQTLCLPHPRVGKNSFPGHVSNNVTGALRTAGAVLWGYPAFSFVLHKVLNSGQTRFESLLRGRGKSPVPKVVAQQLPGADAGSRALRSSVAGTNLTPGFSAFLMGQSWHPTLQASSLITVAKNMCGFLLCVSAHSPPRGQPCVPAHNNRTRCVEWPGEARSPSPSVDAQRPTGVNTAENL